MTLPIVYCRISNDYNGHLHLIADFNEPVWHLSIGASVWCQFWCYIFWTKKTLNNYLSFPTAIDRKQKKHFSTEERRTMPTWVTTMKNHHNPQWNMFTWLIHTTTLSNLQQIAYKIVENHNWTTIVKPFIITCKGYCRLWQEVPHWGIRRFKSNKCWVFAYTKKASSNVNGITLHSLLKLPIGIKVSMTSKEQLSYNFKVTFKM